jgi:hypothetical protein
MGFKTGTELDLLMRPINEENATSCGYALFSARLGMKKSFLVNLHFFAMYLQ